MGLKSIIKAMRDRLKKPAAVEPPPTPPRIVLDRVYLGTLNKDGEFSSFVELGSKFCFVDKEGRAVAVRRDGRPTLTLYRVGTGEKPNAYPYPVDGLDGPE